MPSEFVIVFNAARPTSLVGRSAPPPAYVAPKGVPEAQAEFARHAEATTLARLAEASAQIECPSGASRHSRAAWESVLRAYDLPRLAREGIKLLVDGDLADVPEADAIRLVSSFFGLADLAAMRWLERREAVVEAIELQEAFLLDVLNPAQASACRSFYKRPGQRWPMPGGPRLDQTSAQATAAYRLRLNELSRGVAIAALPAPVLGEVRS